MSKKTIIAFKKETENKYERQFYRLSVIVSVFHVISLGLLSLFSLLLLIFIKKADILLTPSFVVGLFFGGMSHVEGILLSNLLPKKKESVLKYDEHGEVIGYNSTDNGQTFLSRTKNAISSLVVSSIIFALLCLALVVG